MQEVEAELYKLPWQEAADERDGLEKAVDQANLQQSIPEEMMRDGATGKKYSALLSNRGVQNNAEYAFIVKNVANDEKTKVGDQALSTAQYRNQMEFAAWLETLAAATSNVAQLKSKLSIAQRRERYFRKDEGFKIQRAAISRQLAWLQISEHCREGSELNYDDKLKKLKVPFDANLRCLVERVIALAQGLKENYRIYLPLKTPTNGSILDDVSVWLIKVQDELSKFKRAQRLTIVSKWKGTIVASGLDVFNIYFDVEKTDLPSENSLLRGVGFEYDGKNQRPNTLKVLPPQNAWLGAGAGPLLFGRVCPIAPNLELKPQHSDAFWNGSPTGTWKVEGTFDHAAGPIENVVMHMWVVSV